MLFFLRVYGSFESSIMFGCLFFLDAIEVQFGYRLMEVGLGFAVG